MDGPVDGILDRSGFQSALSFAIVGAMHSLRSIARVVLLVLLATVFSPTFGWESTAGMSSHDHSALPDEAHHDAASHDVADSEGCHGHDQAAGSGDIEHHCCPGHVFGHLTGGLGAALQLPLSPGGKAAVDGTQQRFSSRSPDGLERPPKAAA